jgi:hypothetical protein
MRLSKPGLARQCRFGKDFAVASISPMKTMPLEELNLAHFSPWVNTSFRLPITGSEAVELRLIEATAGRSARSFSLIFSGAKLLPQQMYRFEHEQLGGVDLFMVPIGQDAGGFRYQVIFNR